MAASGDDVASMPVLSEADVAKHATQHDCWVIVHGKVYDVSKFVPLHPGGAMIYVKAGGDCSELFDSYHPLRANRTLDKYLIGTLKPTTLKVHYQKQGADDVFYIKLKQKVDSYFRENKLDRRFSLSMYIKTAVIVASVAIFAYLAFVGSSSYGAALVCAALMGVAMAEVGVSIQHDANHGAYCRSTALCYLAGVTLDAVGASSFMWKQQHVVGHHAFTNVDAVDPDIRVKAAGGDVRRVTAQQPLSAHHAYQHLYLGLLYSLLGIKSIFLDDFMALSEGRIGAVKLTKFTWHEALAFWAGKVVFATWFLALPITHTHWSAAQLVGLWAWGLMWTGWTLAFMFQVAHVVEDVSFLKPDPVTGEIPGSWAEQQVATSADFCHGSWLWTHISGGLNYQVVHHLFPGVVHTHYPALAPLVLETAKEMNIPYQVYPTFWAAVRSHFKHLRTMGNSPGAFAIPSLQTIG